MATYLGCVERKVCVSLNMVYFKRKAEVWLFISNYDVTNASHSNQ